MSERVVLSDKQDLSCRLGLAVVLGCLVLAGQVIKGHGAAQVSITEQHRDAIVAALRTYFPAADLGGQHGLEPSVNQIRRRIDEFNEVHRWNPHAETHPGSESSFVTIARVGEIYARSKPISNGFRFEVAIPSETNDVVVVLDAISPPRVTAGQLLAPALFLLMAGALTRWWPRAHAYNRYPWARDMSVIFDRKVSAGERWGFYRLSHLGGGGHLAGLQSNDWGACNDPVILKDVFDDVQGAAEAVLPGIRGQGSLSPSHIEFSQIITSGLASAKAGLAANAPVVECQEDVTTRFRPYIRERLFQFILLPIHSTDWLASVTGCQVQRIDIKPPPFWLIGGYEIYFPINWFEKLIAEIADGLRSAHGASFDSLTVAAHSNHAYINIDFTCGSAELGSKDVSRLRQYLRSPYKGGLSRMTDYMDGFGDVKIIGAQHGFNLSALKRTPDRIARGVCVRLSFRRIAPSELEPLRQTINRTRMT